MIMVKVWSLFVVWRENTAAGYGVNLLLAPGVLNNLTTIIHYMWVSGEPASAGMKATEEFFGNFTQADYGGESFTRAHPQYGWNLPIIEMNAREEFHT
jgi:hypothetical protein